MFNICITKQETNAACHPTMVVMNKKMRTVPTLNITSLASSIRTATDINNKTPVFWYTIPRKDVITYCEDYYSAKSKMQQMLEVRPTSTPKTTSMVYMTAANNACKSFSKITPNTAIQQSALVVDRSTEVIAECPAEKSVCYLYKLQPKSGSDSSKGRRRLSTVDDLSSPLHGRKLQCYSHSTSCTRDSDCCSGSCSGYYQDPAGPVTIGSCTCIENGKSVPAGGDQGCCSYYSSGGVCKDESSDSGGCFPKDATVELEDGRSLPIDQLRLGDGIKVLDRFGNIRAEPALFWLHRNPTMPTSYVRIQAIDMKTNKTVGLRISPNHFLPVGETEVFGQSTMVPAMDLQLGWCIWVKSKDALSPARVTSITPELLRGAYSIMTDSGTVIVDGVAASIHADVVLRDGSLMSEAFVSRKNIPTLHHFFLTPVRLMAKVLGPSAMETLSITSGQGGSFTVSSGMLLQKAVTWAKGI